MLRAFVDYCNERGRRSEWGSEFGRSGFGGDCSCTAWKIVREMKQDGIGCALRGAEDTRSLRYGRRARGLHRMTGHCPVTVCGISVLIR